MAMFDGKDVVNAGAGILGLFAALLTYLISLIAGTFCGTALQASMRAGMPVQARVAVELSLMLCGALGYAKFMGSEPFQWFVATLCSTLATTGAVAMFEGAVFNLLEALGVGKGYFYLAAFIVCCLCYVAINVLGASLSKGGRGVFNFVSNLKLHRR